MLHIALAVTLALGPAATKGGDVEPDHSTPGQTEEGSQPAPSDPPESQAPDQAEPGETPSTPPSGAETTEPAQAEPDPAPQSGPQPGPPASGEAQPDAEGETPGVADSETPAELAPPGKFRTTTTAPEPPPPGYDPEGGVPPGGGYWAPGDRPEAAPPDGKNERIAGYILLPLGTLTLASAAVMTHLSRQPRCPESLEPLGINGDEDQCKALLILNAIRVGYGATAVITGITLIAIGFHRKKKLQEWKRRRFKASVHGTTHKGQWSLGVDVGLRF